jgi:DNA-binding LacI/PurR family transcriptional regulator
MLTVRYWSVCTTKGPLDPHSLGVSVVLAGRPFGNDDDLSYVDADSVGGARMAVRYLLAADVREVLD